MVMGHIRQELDGVWQSKYQNIKIEFQCMETWAFTWVLTVSVFKPITIMAESMAHLHNHRGVILYFLEIPV